MLDPRLRQVHEQVLACGWNRRSGSCAERRQVWIHNCMGMTSGKGRAFAQFTFNGQIPAEQTRQVAADGKSQTGAAILTGGAGIGLLEFLEDARQRFLADADAGIGDRRCADFSPSCWAARMILPACVNLAALLSRLRTICLILS